MGRRVSRALHRAFEVSSQGGLPSAGDGQGRRDPAMTRRIACLLAALIVLAAPLGEGGRSPAALFALHTLTLLCVVLIWSGPSLRRRGAERIPAGPGARPVAAAIAGVSLAVVSALHASYPLAAALGTLDLLAPL